MSKFFLSLKNKPTVVIEFSDDLSPTIKPVFELIYGVAFLTAEQKIGNVLRYEFIPTNPEDNEAVERYFFNPNRIVKEVDVDINFN